MITTKIYCCKFRADDLALLDALASIIPERTKTAVLRRALRHFAAAHGISDLGMTVESLDRKRTYGNKKKS